MEHGSTWPLRQVGRGTRDEKMPLLLFYSLLINISVISRCRGGASRCGQRPALWQREVLFHCRLRTLAAAARSIMLLHALERFLPRNMNETMLLAGSLSLSKLVLEFDNKDSGGWVRFHHGMVIVHYAPVVNQGLFHRYVKYCDYV
jgi:hypothetical protein